MAAHAAMRGGRRPSGPNRVLAGAGLSIAVLLVGAVMALAMAKYPPPMLALGAGIGAVGVLALAIARLEAAVALGFLLLGVVIVEPSPPDGVFAVVMLVAVVTGRFRVDRVPLSIAALILCLLLLNVASAVNAVDPVRAAVFFSITLYLAIFAIWFTGYLDSAKRARQLVVAYLIAGVGSAALGTAAVLGSFPGSTLMTTSDGLRAKALFADPNVFGPFLIPIALILLDEILRPRLLRLRLVTKIGLMGVLIIGLFFSYSRGAWLNFVVAVIVMLIVQALRRGGGKRAAGLLMVMLIGGLSIFGVVMATGQLTFLQERAKGQSYDSQRFAAQRKGIQYGEQNLLGIGPGQFEVLEVTVSHNSYVRTFAEQGFLGFATFVSLMLVTLILAARNAVVGRDSFGIGSGALLGAWVGLAAESFVVDTIHWRHFWLVAALIWVGAMRQSAPQPETRLRSV